MTVVMVPARAVHARYIARRMREADRVEISLGSGKSPFEALAFSMRKSDVAYVALKDGVPVVMFGVGPVNVIAGIGAIWLLGTDDVDRNVMRFLKSSIEWKNKLLLRYPILRNFVHDENVVTKRWLGWLGATFTGPHLFNGHPFLMFEMRAPDV